MRLDVTILRWAQDSGDPQTASPPARPQRITESPDRASGRATRRPVPSGSGRASSVSAQPGRIEHAPAASRRYPSRAGPFNGGSRSSRCAASWAAGLISSSGRNRLQAVVELSDGLRWVEHAQLFGHPAGLAHVVVGLVGIESSRAEGLVAGQEAVDLGRVNPRQQMRIVGPVGHAAGRRARGPDRARPARWRCSVPRRPRCRRWSSR